MPPWWDDDEDWASRNDPARGTPLSEDALFDLRHGFSIKNVLGVPEDVWDIWIRMDLSKPSKTKRKPRKRTPK